MPAHELAHDTTRPVVTSGDGATPPPAGSTLMMEGIVAGYGDVEVLHGVQLALESGKVVALLGANGAGKSTLCAVAAGLVAPAFGTVTLNGVDLTTMPTFQRARAGMLLVPEARGIFPGLTVEENLTILLRSAGAPRQSLRPIRVALPASQATGRRALRRRAANAQPGVRPHRSAHCIRRRRTDPWPRPLIAEEVMRAIIELRDHGSAVLLVEEHAQNALEVADTLAFMELGSIVWTGSVDQADMELLSAAYLGRSVAS